MVFSLWLLVVPSQLVLQAIGHVHTHRRLGIAACLLAIFMVITAGWLQFVQLREAVQTGSYEANAMVNDLGFALGVFDLIAFGGFMTMALLRRRQPQQHKRWIFIATIALMGPVLIQVPGVTSLPPLMVVMSPLIYLVPLIVYDGIATGRLTAATSWGGALSVAYHAVAMVLAGTGTTRAVALWIGAL